MGIYGQDWASYQSAQPSTSGLSFAFIKVTEGTGYTNPEWQSQRDTARAAGLVVGYYHYPNMNNSPTAEADRFLSVAQPRPGEMLCLDWEGYDATNSAVSHAAQLAYKEAFLRHLKAAAPHLPVGMYCSVDYWRTVDTTGYFQDFLWIATVGRAAGDPGISASWLFHQYSDSGSADQDYCPLGSTAELQAWAASFAPKPAPTPAPSPAAPARQQGDDTVAIGSVPAGFAFDASGALTDRGKVVLLALPTVGDGRWPYTLVDLSLAADFTETQDTPIRLRVAVFGTAGWRIQLLDLKSTDARAHVWLQPGDSKASIGRVPLSATDTVDDVPASWLVEC